MHCQDNKDCTQFNTQNLITTITYNIVHCLHKHTLTYAGASFCFSCSLNNLSSNSLQLLHLMLLEMVCKLLSIVDICKTVDHLFRSFWTVYFVKLLKVHSPVFVAKEKSELIESSLEKIILWREEIDVVWSFSLFRYKLRRSFLAPERSSRSISIVATRKALRCESLNGKVWMKCSTKNPLAIVRVSDDRCARPCLFFRYS